MPPWTQLTYSFETQTSIVPISGTDATLSGTAPFLRFTDTDAGHEDWRISVDVDLFKLQWLSGTGPDVWTDVLSFSDPAAATRTLTITDYALDLTGVDAAQVLLRFIVGAEANPRWRIDANGKVDWGPGGASAVDTSLERTGVGILQTATLRLTATPSDVNDATRKTYVDTQDALKVSKSGDTMTGFLTLNADPTAALHAATKQYIDARLPAGGAVAKSGDTMTGTLTFDFSVAGTIIQSKVASEANPRWRVSSAGVVEWGPGGAAAVDIALQRGAADRLDLLDKLRVSGTGGIGIEVLAATALDITAGALARIGTTDAFDLIFKRSGTDKVTIEAARVLFADDLAVGTNPASSGNLRIPNTGAGVVARNAANSANYGLIQGNASDQVLLSSSGNDIKWGRANIALGGGAGATLGTIGGSGPTAAAQSEWVRFIDSAGNVRFLPAWT